MMSQPRSKTKRKPHNRPYLLSNFIDTNADTPGTVRYVDAVTRSRAGVVFVHGFLSSAAVWEPFLALLRQDDDLAGLSWHTFQYASPVVSPHPLRRIPNVNDLADRLSTFLGHETTESDALVLVCHSQGGLVAQRMLARTLADGQGPRLARIRRIVMFACPNSGSDLALSLRRRAWFWRHPQEVELRPLNELVADTHRIVVNQVIHATEVTASTCPIRIVAYAGESDGVVTPASAKSVFPEVGVLPGDHHSVVRPDSHRHPSYLALKHHLLASLREPPAPPATPPVAEAATERSAEETGAVKARPRVGPDLRLQSELVDALLAVPRMSDPSFRDRLYALLPETIINQLPRDPAARIELFSLVGSFPHYPHLAPWEALATALTTLAPGQAQVTAVLTLLERSGLISPTSPHREPGR